MIGSLKRKYFKALTFIAMFVIPLAAPLYLTGIASASIGSDVCGGSTSLSISGGGSCPDSTGSINTLLTQIVNIFSLVVGIIAVIMIIVGGFRYIVSGGESGNVSGAKNAIIYALIGLVVVALAQVLVHFVLTKANTAAAGG